MGRHDQPKSLKRSRGNRKEKTVIALFTEGEVTEVEYLNAVRRLPAIRERFRLDIEDLHGAPSKLMKAAIRMKRADKEVDQCWCVFDVEWPKSNPKAHHPKLEAVLKEADDWPGIECAVSNPTFELWLILHHKLERRALLNEEAEDERHRLDGSKGKSLDGVVGKTHYDGDWYVEHAETACRHALKLDQQHEGVNRFPENNPSSSMVHLMRALGLGH